MNIFLLIILFMLIFFQMLKMICVCVCEYVDMSAMPKRPEQGIDLLELELLVVVSCFTWVLGPVEEQQVPSTTDRLSSPPSAFLTIL